MKRYLYLIWGVLVVGCGFSSETGSRVQIIEFSLEPDTVLPGGCSILKWRVQNASELYIKDEQGNIIAKKEAGEYKICPSKTKIYTMVVFGIDQRSWLQREIRLEVIPINPRIEFFKAEPEAVEPGQRVYLQWIISGLDLLALSTENLIIDMAIETEKQGIIYRSHFIRFKNLFQVYWRKEGDGKFDSDSYHLERFKKEWLYSERPLETREYTLIITGCRAQKDESKEYWYPAKEIKDEFRLENSACIGSLRTIDFSPPLRLVAKTKVRVRSSLLGRPEITFLGACKVCPEEGNGCETGCETCKECKSICIRCNEKRKRRCDIRCSEAEEECKKCEEICEDKQKCLQREGCKECEECVEKCKEECEECKECEDKCENKKSYCKKCSLRFYRCMDFCAMAQKECREKPIKGPISKGEKIYLVWRTKNATHVEIQPKVLSKSERTTCIKEVTPEKTTTYILTAWEKDEEKGYGPKINARKKIKIEVLP